MKTKTFHLRPCWYSLNVGNPSVDWSGVYQMLLRSPVCRLFIFPLNSLKKKNADYHVEVVTREVSLLACSSVIYTSWWNIKPMSFPVLYFITFKIKCMKILGLMYFTITSKYSLKYIVFPNLFFYVICFIKLSLAMLKRIGYPLLHDCIYCNCIVGYWSKLLSFLDFLSTTTDIRHIKHDWRCIQTIICIPYDKN